jgi:CDGSH-type Zn-finger protein
MKIEPWIDPDGDGAKEIIETINQCPSGALSYTVDGVRHQDQERSPAIKVSKNAPYEVTGGIELLQVEWGEGASREHYTLCRCGASKNKPFCDGTHWSIEFTDHQTDALSAESAGE